MPNVLKIEFPRPGEERLFRFQSHLSPHTARMNVLDEHIVVEHDVEVVGSATFDIGERKKAIQWIEHLFAYFCKLTSSMKCNAFKEGRAAALAHEPDSGNPYEQKDLRNMWFRGYDSCIIVVEDV